MTYAANKAKVAAERKIKGAIENNRRLEMVENYLADKGEYGLAAAVRCALEYITQDLESRENDEADQALESYLACDEVSEPIA